MTLARIDGRRSVCSTSPAREPLPATTPVRFVSSGGRCALSDRDHERHAPQGTWLRPALRPGDRHRRFQRDHADRCDQRSGHPGRRLAVARSDAVHSYPPGGLVVNLLNAGVLHDVFRAVLTRDCRQVTRRPCRRSNPARGLFVIGTDGTVQVYTRLSTYQAALQQSSRPDVRRRSFVASGGTMSMPEDAHSQRDGRGIAVRRTG